MGSLRRGEVRWGGIFINNFIAQFQLSIRQWKNCENRSIFSKDMMDKSIVSPFFTYGVYRVGQLKWIQQLTYILLVTFGSWRYKIQWFWGKCGICLDTHLGKHNNLIFIIWNVTFFRSFNSVYQKCCRANRETCLAAIVNSYCKPHLLYAIEFLQLSHTAVKKLNAWLCALSKIICVKGSDLDFISEMFERYTFETEVATIDNTDSAKS